MNRKPFLVELAELIVAHWPTLGARRRRLLRAFLPTPGNVLFTLLAVAGLLWAQSAGALPQSLIPNTQSLPTTIAYQGHLADSALCSPAPLPLCSPAPLLPCSRAPKVAGDHGGDGRRDAAAGAVGERAVCGAGVDGAGWEHHDGEDCR